MQSTIVELVRGRVYADRTVFGELELTFRHDLAPTTDGGTRVRHTLTIEGPGADQIAPELGPQISSDFPTTMSELLAAAQQHAMLQATEQ